MSAEQHRGRSINDKRNWISHIVWNVSLYHINICLHIIVISRWYDGLSSHHGRWVTYTMLLNICVQFVAMHVTTFRLVFFLSPVSTGDSIWTGWRTQTTSYAMSYKIHNQATAFSHSHHKCVIRLVSASCGMRLRALFFVFSFFVSVCVCCLCDLLIANDAVASTQTKKEKNISFHFHLCVVLIRRMSEWASGVAGGSHLRWTEFLYIFYCNFFYCFRFVFVD